MVTEKLFVGNIPAVIWGKPADRVFIAVHGNMSNKEDTVIRLFADHAVKHGYQVISFDLPEHGDRKATVSYPCNVQNSVADLGQIMEYTKQRYTGINLWACSMGAYFAFTAYRDETLGKAVLLSPVVDMKAVIDGMMLYSGVNEAELKEKKEIKTDFGQTLYWDYYSFVKEHPVTKWDCETHILFGKKDTVQNEETVRSFSQKFGCDLAVSKESEHYFHTDKQLETYKNWLERVVRG